MANIIEWSNQNQGFISALLALLSMVLSIIAIYVSIRVAHITFQKKIEIAFYTNLGVGQSSGIQFYSIEATNIGNRIVKVSYVGIGYKEKGKWVKGYNKNSPNPTNIRLDISESTEAQYEIPDINALMECHTLYAIAIDVEGTIYKRKIK